MALFGSRLSFVHSAVSVRSEQSGMRKANGTALAEPLMLHPAFGRCLKEWRRPLDCDRSMTVSDGEQPRI